MDPSVDPSDRSVENREEKRIKLIQQGDLDQFGFEQEDPVFDFLLFVTGDPPLSRHVALIPAFGTFCGGTIRERLCWFFAAWRNFDLALYLATLKYSLDEQKLIDIHLYQRDNAG